SVHHTRNRREQFDQVLQQRLKSLRKVPPKRVKVQIKDLQYLEDRLSQVALAEEDGGSDTECRAKKQGQQRCVQRAPDFGQDSISVRVWVPGCPVQERQTMIAKGRHSLDADLKYEKYNQDNSDRGEGNT